MFAFDMNQLVGGIVTKEWDMFLNINGGRRVAAQDRPVMYFAIRRAYFYAWSREAAYNYYTKDLAAAQATGRNLPREKYIYMMKNTDPKGFGELSFWLPQHSERKEQLVNTIWHDHMLHQMVDLCNSYPHFVLDRRPLRISDETDKTASIEAHKLAEMLTYSEKTLELLLQHIIDQENLGISFMRKVMENMAKGLNYSSLEDAEADYRNNHAKKTMRPVF